MKRTFFWILFMPSPIVTVYTVTHPHVLWPVVLIYLPLLLWLGKG